MGSVTSEDSSFEDVEDVYGEFDRGEEGEEEGEDLGLGKDLEVKKLYRNKTYKWVDELPKEEKIQKTARPAANSNYAIITRHYVQDEELCLHSVVVQSPVLKALLARVFENYPQLNAAFRGKRLIFEAPFRDFFYRWPNYEDLLVMEGGGPGNEYLKLFDSIIRPEVAPHVAEHIDILQTGVVRFADAWTLFHPGTEVYTRASGDDRLYIFESVCGAMGTDLSLICKYVTWTGHSFRWTRQTLTLFAYDGCQAVTDLSVLPLDFHPQARKLEKRLTKRGRKFESLSGIFFKSYTGQWSPKDRVNGASAFQTLQNGRILTDASFVQSPLLREDFVHPVFDPFAGASPPPPRHVTPSPGFMTQGKKPKKGKARNLHAENDNDLFSWFDPDCVLFVAPFRRFCPAAVHGFCLTTKQWGEFNVDDVRDIEFNPATFRRLVLPSDYKDLILAFVTSQMESLDSFDDIVDGKGRGITILLRGEPGVGKTLTAEAVAEEVQRPLYTLSAGDLGHDAQDVEANLTSKLDLCARWGAILLVDECDVFLEQRAATDIERNKLVAVFLRLLEYYKGVIFLTTNRGGMIDRAFQSRIALNIQYPILDGSAKKHIWETFVRPSVDFPHNDSDLTDADIDCLSGLSINGREIKNLVKTGRLLAKKKGQRLTMGHLRTVLRVQNMLIKDNADAHEDF